MKKNNQYGQPHVRLNALNKEEIVDFCNLSVKILVFYKKAAIYFIDKKSN